MTGDRRRRGLLAFGAALLAGAGLVSCAPAASPTPEAPEFGYTGATGPDAWGELDPDWATCASGERQSPIDLVVADAAEVADPEFRYAPGPATVEDTGHTVQVTVAEGSTVRIDGTTYRLVQGHIHVPGEHVFGGTPAEAEWHFVHRDDTGSIAVVGILLEIGAASEAWEPVLTAAADAMDEDTPQTLATFDPASLLPADLASRRYAGSLTTPPCSEGVRWVVLTDRIEISAEQFEAIHQRLHGNARPVQDRNDRPIQADEADR